MSKLISNTFGYNGFAVGKYIGISIESHFAIGNELVRCISFNRGVLVDKMREKAFKVASFDGDMEEAHPVELLLIVEKRRNVSSLIQLIKKLDRTAVYSLSDVKSVNENSDFLTQ